MSKTFFGWLAQFGNQMKVMELECVAAKYKEHIEQIRNDWSEE